LFSSPPLRGGEENNAISQSINYFFRHPCDDNKSMRFALDFSHQSRLPRKGRGFGDNMRFALVSINHRLPKQNGDNHDSSV